MSDRDYIDDAQDVVDGCLDREGENRREAVVDQKFAAGEQWDEAWMRAEDRKRTKQAVITVNQLPQYINQVRNDIRQNRPSIKARPVDNRADIELADIYGGIMRHAQDVGKADTARDVGMEAAVLQGLGWYRLRTDYTDPTSFDQEPVYDALVEPHNVYHDDFRTFDGSDLKRVVITSTISLDEFEQQYKDAGKVSFGDTSVQSDADDIQVAEFYCVEERDDRLLMLADGSSILESDAKRRVNAGEALASPMGRERSVRVPYVYWRKLSGDEELESRELMGQFIPVFPVIGSVARIEGKIIRFGLVRFARDPQRYYNWLKAAEIEYLENAPKAPWVGDARAFDPYKQFWQNANTVNYGYLPFASTDDNGNPIAQPTRTQPAMIPSGLMQAGTIATDDIKKSIGMYSAAIGARGSATSGKQELLQQRESDTGTFHFADNLAKTVLHEGRVLMQWIPKLYGQRQVARIIGIDDEPQTVRLTQALPQALTKVNTSKGIEKIYNLGVGRYDVTVTVGPSYATKRLESASLLTEMVRANPAMMQMAGDIVVKAYDIPGGEELAQRLKAFLPPQVLQSEGQEGEQSQEQLQQAMTALQAKAQQLQQREQQLKLISDKMAEQDQQVTAEAQKVASERAALKSELQVMQAKQREIESELQMVAMREAERVRKAAESAMPEGDGGQEVLRQIQDATDALKAERAAFEALKREAGLEFELKMERAKSALKAAVPEPATAEGATEPAERAESEPEVTAALIDLAPINAALSALLEAQKTTPRIDLGEIRDMIRSESVRTQAAVTKAIAGARTVKVEPKYDDDGNVIGGNVVSADGKRHVVEIPESE